MGDNDDYYTKIDDYIGLDHDLAAEVAAEDERRNPRRQLNCGSPVGKRRKLIKTPNIKNDIEEVRRLMNRVPKDEPKKDYYGCGVCLAKDPNHIPSECPYFDEIPKGVTQLGYAVDTVCLGCDKIGDPPCCGKGTYATRKFCGGCRGSDHWYWEKRCPKDYVFSPSTVKLPDVEYEEVSVIKEVNGTSCKVPGYFKMKKVKSGSSSKSRKTWKRVGKKIVSGVKKITL
ncbi:hypothetical protein ACHQM5_000167 [Ranunculus cassubicifolius]